MGRVKKPEDQWSQTTDSLGSAGSDEWDRTTVADKDDHLRSEASIMVSVLNLVNNTVGAGLFSLSWCLKESTLVTGVAMMLFMCILNGLSFILLAQCCELASTCSYLKMMQTAFGKRGGLIAQICVLMYGCGSCISFVVLTGDFLVGKGTGVLDAWSDNSTLHSRPLVMMVVAVVLFFPLSSLRNLEPLKYTSFVSFGATCYATAICVWGYANDSDAVFTPENQGHQHDIKESVDYIGFPIGVFAALPLINVAYTCHYNAPRYYAELKDRSIRRWSYVVAIVMTFVFMIYAVAAVAGYLLFGDQTDGDILKNFSVNWKPAVVARLALASLVIFTFPMTCHFIRDSVIDLYYDGEYSTDSCPPRPYYFITCLIIVIATGVGITITKVEVVLAYKGAIFGSAMVYIFPPMMYVVLKAKVVKGSHLEGLEVQRDSQSEYSRRSRKTNQTDHSEVDPLVVTGELQNNSYLEQLKVAVLDPANGIYTLFMFWGFSTGILGVVVTIIKQAT